MDDLSRDIILLCLIIVGTLAFGFAIEAGIAWMSDLGIDIPHPFKN